MYRIAQDINHKNIDCITAKGLTWSYDTIDDAYKAYKKIFPDCIIVKVL